MSRFIAGLLLPAFILGLVLFFAPATAQAAKRITLQNASGSKIWVALVLQTYNGWRVRGWYEVAPYSYKNVNFDEAGGQTFGVYAYAGNNGPVWSGKNNDPTITIAQAKMNHDVRQTPYGPNQRRVKVRMVNGNSYKFYTTGQQQQPRQSGWW